MCLLHNALGTDLLTVLYKVLILSAQPLSTYCLLPQVPRKKFRVVGYATSHIDLVFTTAGHNSNDIDLATSKCLPTSERPPYISLLEVKVKCFFKFTKWAFTGIFGLPQKSR